MHIRIRALLISSACLLACLSGFPPGSEANSNERRSRATILHHQLDVQIDPTGHGLLAQDLLLLEVPQRQAIQFSLAATLIVDRMSLLSSGRTVDETAQELPFEVEHPHDRPSTQTITIPETAWSSPTMLVRVIYRGTINDPPREPRHLRFVTPSETAGHIGPEGVYLSGETQWYPDLPNSLSTFDLRVALPEGWTAISQAKPGPTVPCGPERCRASGFLVTEWGRTLPSEALTVVANRFVVNVRQWTSQTGQPVQLATYLFPEDAALADEYLDATARYLDAYIPLLGPYPFDSFSVVENFFSSGLGMPSFTLLGSGIIKRHYVQPYALGHEIVHSWIGNSVYNRVDHGNWVEGLTTYLANYYWYELIHDPVQAREQRKLFLRGYNLQVPPERDYPVGQFTQKQDERDNAIGYQKAAMVFHHLRQEVGEDGFWSGLKLLVKTYSGRHAEWGDLERIFTDSSRRDLRGFFSQWIERAGAPSVTLATVQAHHLQGSSSFRLQATIAQSSERFSFSLPVHILMEDGTTRIEMIRVESGRESISIDLPSKPIRVLLDPDSMVLRRLPRHALPPVLTHYVTDRRRSVIVALPQEARDPHPLRQVLARIEAQEAVRPSSERTTPIPLAEGGLLPKEGSVLVLADPGALRTLASFMQPHCGDQVELRETGATVAETTYEGPGTAALVNCHRRDASGSVLSVVYAVTPNAAAAVARLLFFYGWNSYVVFKEGAVVARGEWASPTDVMEVPIDAVPAVH